VAVAIVLVLVLKQTDAPTAASDRSVPVAPQAAPEQPADPPPDEPPDADADTDDAQQLPRFVEVGAHSCTPCKMMQPVLDELKSDYAGRLSIEFADVWENPELGDKYEVQTIPTQVIYDASGTEVFRHIGFWAKEEIDAKLLELGILE
jgi:thioredoxin 1